MRCPHCNSKEIEVIDFKDTDISKIRTYGCNGCRKKFVTYELIKTGERKKI